MQRHHGSKIGEDLGTVLAATGPPASRPAPFYFPERHGTARYFRPGLSLDHWITEYWHEADERWVRVSPRHVADLYSRPEPRVPAELIQ